jgi:DNA polymerase III gamma/tau subunit
VALEAIRDQPRAVDLLRRALSAGRVAQAYAFVGPAGSGRMTTARAFAQALLCDTGQGCGRCRGCLLVAAGQHPDLHVLVPTPPENRPKGPLAIRIDAVRDLERQASLRPALGGRRVLILDGAERMTADTPPVFLKFLEEPPPGTVVILVLSGLRAVPATVISRCQIVRFQSRDDGRAAAAVGEALALLQAARSEGLPGLFRRTDRLDREKAESLVDGCWLLCRDLLLARAGVPAALLTDTAHAEALAAEAAAWSDEGLRTAVETCRHARETLINNVTPRLTVEAVVGRLLTRSGVRT